MGGSSGGARGAFAVGRRGGVGWRPALWCGTSPTQDAKELDMSKFGTGPLSHSEMLFNGAGGWDAPYLPECWLDVTAPKCSGM